MAWDISIQAAVERKGNREVAKVVWFVGAFVAAIVAAGAVALTISVPSSEQAAIQVQPLLAALRVYFGAVVAGVFMASLMYPTRYVESLLDDRFPDGAAPPLRYDPVRDLADSVVRAIRWAVLCGAAYAATVLAVHALNLIIVFEQAGGASLSSPTVESLTVLNSAALLILSAAIIGAGLWWLVYAHLDPVLEDVTSADASAMRLVADDHAIDDQDPAATDGGNP